MTVTSSIEKFNVDELLCDHMNTRGNAKLGDNGHYHIGNCTIDYKIKLWNDGVLGSWYNGWLYRLAFRFVKPELEIERVTITKVVK